MIDVTHVALVAASDASDAAQNVVNSLNQASVTGWDVAAAVIVVLLSLPAARLVSRAIRRGFRSAGLGSDDAAADVALGARWLVYLLGVAIAASILGVNVGFLSVLVGFGLVIGALALKPMIENSASGVLLITRPAFSVGDQIKTTEFRGVVEEIGSRSTRIRQADGVVVYVSNNQVLGNPIVVYSEEDSRKGVFDITVPWNSDLDQLSETLISAVTSVDDVVDDPAPAVQATELTDNAIKLQISYWYPSTMLTGASAADRVIRAATAALMTAGAELAVPTTDVREEVVSSDRRTATNTSSVGSRNDAPANDAAT